jgi:hypothetical protein
LIQLLALRLIALAFAKEYGFAIGVEQTESVYKRAVAA